MPEDHKHRRRQKIFLHGFELLNYLDGHGYTTSWIAAMLAEGFERVNWVSAWTRQAYLGTLSRN